MIQENILFTYYKHTPQSTYKTLLHILNYNLLLIASFYKESGLEFIDLRENKAKWKLIKVPHKKYSLSSMFDLDIKPNIIDTKFCVTKM